jgi:hypothetical protein
MCTRRRGPLLPLRVRKVGSKYHVIFVTSKRLGVFESEELALEYIKEVKDKVKARKEK